MLVGRDNQRTPLVVQIEMQPPDADLVWHHLENDNESAIQDLLSQGNLEGVLRPKLRSPSAGSKTSLHKAAKHGAEKCLKVILNHKPTSKDLESPNVEGATALLVAVEEAQPGAVRQLLEAGANINARSDSGRSALHVLVSKLSTKKNEEQQRRLQEVADIFLSTEQVTKLDMEPHAPRTPLAAAAVKLLCADASEPWLPGLLKLCKKLVAAGASLLEDAGSGKTVKTVLKEKGCLATEQQGQTAPRRPTAAHVVDEVFRGRGSEEVQRVLQDRPREEALAAVNSRLGTRSLLWRAVDNNKTLLVKTLLDHGANPWEVEVTGEMPLQCAAYVGNESIFTQLLEKMKGNYKSLDLRNHTVSLVRNLMQKGSSKAGPQDADHMACLRRLLQEDVMLDLNQEERGETALHVAAAFNNQEAVSEVLRNGAFLGAQRSVLGKRWGTVLDSVLPATLDRAMDGCITHYSTDANAVENMVSEDYTLRLDYRFLLPPQQEGDRPVNEMETLMAVCRSRRHRRVILHPLVQTLLYAKWRKALPLYLLNVAVYLFFVVVLTFFVYSLKDLRVLEARLERLQLNGTTADEAAVFEKKVEEQEGTVQLLMALLLTASAFMLVREVFQIIFSREIYVKNIENYLEWFLLVVVLVLCAADLGVDVTRHVAAWAMIVAWYEFVLVLGRAPPLALYITMLRHVSWNFLKLIFLFSALILAFTFSFNIILQSPGDDPDEDFTNFWTTLPKAIVMSTGEFEYSDLSDKFPRTVLMTSAVMVFLVFLFLIFLVLMNVMNGLAVTDTQQVVEDAKLYSLTSRLELVYLVESLFLYCPWLRSRISSVQLLSGTGQVPSLLVKINNPKKNKRLLSGKDYETLSKLDGDTTECLRLHRQHHLEELSAKESEERNAQLIAGLQRLVQQTLAA